MKKYYSLAVEERTASIYIYGDIVGWEWFESDVSSYTLAKEIEGLDVDTINVYINSYGGEVAEGLAIHNALKRHPAKIKTVCDGFACSAAVDVFAAGDERVMCAASLLMIHNAWVFAIGNSAELEKQAADLRKINDASIKTLLGVVSIAEDEFRQLMDDETWISPEEALEMGLATAIVNAVDNKKPSQSLRSKLSKMILNWQAERQEPEPDPEPEPGDPPEPEQEPEPEPVPDEPVQNKTQKLMAALFR